MKKYMNTKEYQMIDLFSKHETLGDVTNSLVAASVLLA